MNQPNNILSFPDPPEVKTRRFTGSLRSALETRQQTKEHFVAQMDECLAMPSQMASDLFEEIAAGTINNVQQILIMTESEIKDVLELHIKWVQNNPAGKRADLAGADLTGTNLSGANLTRAYLTGANLSRADLSRADLTGTNLSGAYLSRANLSGADLTETNLSGANLSGAYLSRAYLSRANLSGADLTRADLAGANLSGANLSGADLTETNLSGAYLTGADLAGAYLSGADLTETNLSGANLSGATLHSYAQVSFSGHGERGRMLTAIIQQKGDNILFSCGCFSGNEEAIREYIWSGKEHLKESRFLALETAISLVRYSQEKSI